MRKSMFLLVFLRCKNLVKTFGNKIWYKLQKQSVYIYEEDVFLNVPQFFIVIHRARTVMNHRQASESKISFPFYFW